MSALVIIGGLALAILMNVLILFFMPKWVDDLFDRYLPRGKKSWLS